MVHKKEKRVWIFIVICPITYFYILNEELNLSVEGGKFMCLIRRGGESEGDDWILNHVRRGLDEENIL